MVGFDSIIQPGRVGKVTQEISVSALHGGEFRKYITVFSNAKNMPELRLSLGGKIRNLLSSSPDFLNMRRIPSGRNEVTIKLTTDKKDLSIQDISFLPKQENTGVAWQSTLPLAIEYVMSKADTAGTDGYYSYNLQLLTSYAGNENKLGDFIIKTNHPKKGELKLGGMIEAQLAK